MQRQPRFKRFFKWLPTGVSSVFTIHFILQSAPFQAVAAFLATAASVFWASLSEGFLEGLEEGGKQRGKSLAEGFWKVLDRLPGIARLRWQMRSFKGNYCESLADSYREMQTEGFRIGLPTLDLEDVFVPLKVATNIPSKIAAGMIAVERQEQGQEIWDFLSQSRKEPAFRRLAVIAPPGSGKTTLLQHVTLIYAKGAHRQKPYKQYNLPELIPVLIYLRQVRQRITTAPLPSLPQLIVEVVRQQPALGELNPPPDWFEQKLQRGECLVMLDGLDEVANARQRQQVSAWVNEQMQRYRKAAFVLTSRPYGWESAPVDRVGIVLEVKPFTVEQMKQFVRNWYVQTEVMSRGGRDTPAVRERAGDSAADLIAAIVQNRAIAAMARNPLLVTMIATVHYCGSALPGRRVELYQKICDVLLGSRQLAKKIETRLTTEQNKAVLQVLALNLMWLETRSFSLAQGAKIVREALATVNDQLAPEQFLKDVKELSGLLVEKEMEVYEFAHLSFQEYLAATQITQMGDDTLLVQHFGNPWWAETIRLYAAQSDATRLIQVALKNLSIKSLHLAYDCSEEGLSVTPAVRKQLLDLLETGLESDDLQRANLATLVRISRRLSNLLPIDEDREIDLYHISRAEYQMYLNYAPEEETEQFEPGTATHLVDNSDLFEALGFCGFLNLNAFSEIFNQTYYRLPTKDEVLAHPARDGEKLKCWMQEDRYSTTRKGIRVVREKMPDLPSIYRQLFQHLVAGEWRAADEETLRVMLKVAKREKQGYLDGESIKQFPCDDLRTINQLWMQASGGWFGFSVQKEIWKRLGGKIDSETEERLGDAIGWRMKGSWRSYDELLFILNGQTPQGHLPIPHHLSLRGEIVVWVGKLEWGVWCSSLAQRCVACSM